MVDGQRDHAAVGVDFTPTASTLIVGLLQKVSLEHLAKFIITIASVSTIKPCLHFGLRLILVLTKVIAIGAILLNALPTPETFFHNVPAPRLELGLDTSSTYFLCHWDTQALSF